MGAGYHGGFGSTDGAKRQSNMGAQTRETRVVKLLLDYLKGPIWKSDSKTGRPLTGIAIIDNDDEVLKLNLECCQLYSSCYYIDLNGCVNGISKERLSRNKGAILHLLDAIKERLEIINDGSYIVRDMATERIKSI